MGTARSLIARGIVGAALALPVLGTLDIGGTLLSRALLVAVATCATWHGHGQLVGWASGRRPHPALAMTWGIGVVALLAGIALVLGLRAQRPVLFAGVALHVLAIVREPRRWVDQCTDGLAWERLRWWGVPAVLVTALGAIALLGSIGLAARPFDDDGHVLAAVKRVLDTGALSDGVGYARGSQLGAVVSLAAIPAAFGGIACGRLVDALGLVLVLVLVSRRIDGNDAPSMIWRSLLVLALGAMPLVAPDPVAPLWLPIALCFALYETVEGTDSSLDAVIPAALLTGALGALRLEWLPIGVVLVLAGLRMSERAGRGMRIAISVAGASTVLLPYVIVRMATAHGAAALLAAPSHASAYAISAVIMLVASPIVLVATRPLAGQRVRWVPFAVVACYVAIGTRLTTSSPYGYRYLWPIAVAGLTIAIVELVRRESSRSAGTALVVALTLVIVLQEAREARGGQRWSVRAADTFDNINYLRHTGRASSGKPYGTLLSRIPRGDVVAIWVARPETIDYARNTVVDLHTPRAGRLTPDRFARLLRATGARYLLVEGELQRDTPGQVIDEREGVQLRALR